METLKEQVSILAIWYCNPGVVAEALVILSDQLGGGELHDTIVRSIIDDVHLQVIEKCPFKFEAKHLGKIEMYSMLCGQGEINVKSTSIQHGINTMSG